MALTLTCLSGDVTSTFHEQSAAESLPVRASWLSTKDTFDLLSKERRRHALDCLARLDERVSVTRLAAEVAAMEQEIQPESVSAADQHRVHVALHHVHLPKLADYGVIEYDTDRELVRLADDLEVARPCTL